MFLFAILLPQSYFKVMLFNSSIIKRHLLCNFLMVFVFFEKEALPVVSSSCFFPSSYITLVFSLSLSLSRPLPFFTSHL